MTRRATVIRQEREQAQYTLLLDAGNSILGEKEPAKKSLGKSSIEAMNLMGYDAMTLGSLDLMLGLDDLKQRIGEADFAVLSANAYLANSKELVATPYVVLERADHRVGILGITDLASTQDIVVADPLQTARERVPELRGQADIVIVLSHAGVKVDKVIAEQVPGIDLIVSGNTVAMETPYIAPLTGAVVVHAEAPHAGTAGTYIGVADLSFDASGKLLRHDWSRTLLNISIAEDPTMAKWLQEAKAK